MSSFEIKSKQTIARLKQKIAKLKQNIVDLNKKLSEIRISDKECKENNAALEKQLIAQTKMILKLKNKDRRRKQQRYFPQQRHSQQEDNFHQQDTTPQMQSYHVLSPKNTQQREEVTCKYSDLQGQPEQQLETNNTDVQYMVQKVLEMAENSAEVTKPHTINCETIINDQTNSMARKKSRAFEEESHEKVRDENIVKDIIFAGTTGSGVSEEEVRNTISTIRAEEEIPRNANCATFAHGDRIHNDGRLEIGKAEMRNNLELLCSVALRHMAICFPDEPKRKASVMDNESGTEQNCSQELLGVQSQSKSAVATNRPRISQSSKHRCITPELSQEVSNDKVASISIGPNKTLVPQKYFESTNFTNPSLATRKLLVMCFDCKTLATHSLTGKRSPAFPDKPLKKALDPRIIEDIIVVVTTRCGVSAKEVRAAITTKCADESKMWRKKHPELSKKADKENVGNYTF